MSTLKILLDDVVVFQQEIDAETAAPPARRRPINRPPRSSFDVENGSRQDITLIHGVPVARSFVWPTDGKARQFSWLPKGNAIVEMQLVAADGTILESKRSTFNMAHLEDDLMPGETYTLVLTNALPGSAAVVNELITVH